MSIMVAAIHHEAFLGSKAATTAGRLCAIRDAALMRIASGTEIEKTGHGTNVEVKEAMSTCLSQGQISAAVEAEATKEIATEIERQMIGFDRARDM